MKAMVTEVCLRGIFMRYYVQLIMEPIWTPYIRRNSSLSLNNNAEILWRKGINKLDLLYNTNWAMNNSGNNHLTTQASGCTLIKAKALFERKKLRNKLAIKSVETQSGCGFRHILKPVLIGSYFGNNVF